MGAKAYKLIEKYKDTINGAIVEIGSERNEGSTTYLHSFANSYGYNFYTIDFNKDRYLNALHITQGKCAYNMLGEEFLGNIFPLLGQKISFAYLDNFDLVTHDGRDWTERKGLYKSYGLDMNNTNSRIAHMTQALLVERNAADNCYILFDDTWIDKDTKEYDGKGAWGIRPLLLAGFKILNEVPICDEAYGLANGYVFLGRTK